MFQNVLEIANKDRLNLKMAECFPNLKSDEVQDYMDTGAPSRSQSPIIPLTVAEENFKRLPVGEDGDDDDDEDESDILNRSLTPMDWLPRF